MYAIKATFQGRSFFFYKGQDFLPGVDKARLFSERKRAVGVADKRFPAAKVMPVETRPALYRIRLGTSYYLTGPTSFLTFQNGKQGSRTFTRDVALILVKNYENAIIVPAV
jgi:hypothetical protein